MTKLKLLTAALAASACFASQAIAADMYSPTSMKDAPIEAPVVYNWTGFYIGGGIGGAQVNYSGATSGTFDPDGIGVGPAVPFALPIDDDAGSLFGTAQLGYDHQLHSRFVVGLFADYDWHSDTDTTVSATLPLIVPGDTLAVSASAELDNTWTLGGRFGALVTPTTLLYGLVGWTHADLSMSGAFTSTIAPGLPTTTVFSVEDEIDALTLGAGIETMLRPGISVKFEYRYTDLDGLSAVSDLAAGVATGSALTDIESDLHTVRAVLTWRPGM